MDPNTIQVTLSSPVGAVDWVQMITSICQATGVVIASIVAIRGIHSWRQEFQGKRRIELAEDALTTVYEVRDAIAGMRSPFSFAGESEGRTADENETAGQKRGRDRAYVMQKRFEQRSTVFSKLWSMRYRVMALMREDAVEPINEIKAVIAEMSAATSGIREMYEAYDDLHDRGDKSKGIRDLIQKYNKVLGWVSPEEDEIKKRVDAAVSQMDSICGPIIKKCVS